MTSKVKDDMIDGEGAITFYSNLVFTVINVISGFM